MAPENHPTNDMLGQFGLGSLPGSEHEQVERHLRECNECWERFVATERDDDAFVTLVRQSAAQASCMYESVAANTESAVAAKGNLLSATNRYELLEQIASGGMGLIWIAYDVLLNREVAIKVLRDSQEFDTDSKYSLLHDQFVRESQIISSLQHPGIPPVYDLGKFDNGKPFLAMKLVRGKTLAQRMAGREAPTIGWLLEVFTQVCQTLAFAHSRGVVHRDLKPENVMVGQFGETQVMDWGISEYSNQYDDQDFCAPKAIVGTPAYMSPEQASGRKCGPQADVFSLGSILCNMLTGAPAYQGRNTSDLMEQAAAGNVEDAISRLHRCNADPAMIKLAESCLARSEIDRPADAGEVAERVTMHLHSAQAQMRKAELESARSQARSHELMRRRRTQRWLAFTAVCLVAVSLFAWNAQRKRIQDTVEQVKAAIAEAQRLSAKARAASEGGREHLESALTAASRATRLSRETNDPNLQHDAQSLRIDLMHQCATAKRLEQLQFDLKRAMIFEEGNTVEQRYRNRQQRLRQAVAEGRRSTLLFLEFPTGSIGRDPTQRMSNTNPSTNRGPLFGPPNSLDQRPGGRVRQATTQEYVSGKENVFRYAELRRREYERAFADFGIRTDMQLDDGFAQLTDLQAEDRAMVTKGLRMWFLFAADTQSESAAWLSELLDRIGLHSYAPVASRNWCHEAFNAMCARDVDAIESACAAAQPIMADLPPELLWGLGCYQLRCSSEDNNNSLLRHAQRYFLDSFLLNRELAKHYRTHDSGSYITGALSVCTDYELSIQLARNLVGRGRIDEYEIIRDRCFAQYPGDSMMLADWGDFMAMHRRPEVFVTYEKAIEEGFPEPQVLLAKMGQLFQRSGLYDSAKELYSKALELEALPEDHAAELRRALSALPNAGQP